MSHERRKTLFIENYLLHMMSGDRKADVFFIVSLRRKEAEVQIYSESSEDKLYLGTNATP